MSEYVPLPSSTGMVLCLIAAILAALVGLASISQATTGAVFMAGACFWAVLARIAQAGRQHKQVMRALAERQLEVR